MHTNCFNQTNNRVLVQKKKKKKEEKKGTGYIAS